MKKNNQTKPPNKNAAAKAPRRARKSARSVKDPRWSFELGATEWGPFKTKGAKINSARSMVGLGERAIDIQRKMPRLRTTINENGNTVDLLTGTDFITSIVSAATTAPGDILFKQEISPSKLVNTRLLQFSQLYQRYRFKRISFLYEPIASATQSGQLLGFADFDVDNQINTNSTENLAIGAAHQGQAITQIWQPIEFDMGQVLTFTDLFTEVGSSSTDDQRMSIQGVFYLLAASALPEHLSLGNIYVDYEIEFSIPYLSIASTLLEKQSAGSLSGNAALPPSGETVTFNSQDEGGGFGPVTVTTDGLGSRTMLFQGMKAGDQLYVYVQFNTPGAQQLAQLPAGTTNYLALVNTPPVVEGGEIWGSTQQWRNISDGAGASYGAHGMLRITINVTSSNGTYLDIMTPVWATNWSTGMPDHPTITSLYFVTWYLTPAATVERTRRERMQKAIRDAPLELEEMRSEMRKLALQLAIVRNSHRLSPEAKDKEKAADEYPESSSSSSTGFPSASPSVPRSASPNIVLTPGQRPRSSSMLARSVSPRVSDEIAHYGSDKESW